MSSLVGFTSPCDTSEELLFCCASVLSAFCVDTPSGYVWHHNEETGKMQLVKVEDHDRTQGGAAHTGGKALWGGSYSNHETSTTTEPLDAFSRSSGS